MPDSLGDRMKEQYENRSRSMLPRRTNTIIRVDGKAFHSFTKQCHCVRPYDGFLATALDVATVALCQEAQGARLAYIQSDEISVLLTDYTTITTEAWFSGNVQKVCSVAASVVTAVFNAHYKAIVGSVPLALFDARTFVIPDPVEVENYFIWRQQDATRNSISMLAHTHFSTKQLHGKSSAEAQEMLFQHHGLNWNDTPTYWKRGRCVVRTGEGWDVDGEIPIFTAQREYLSERIGKRED
jgi:tRNA(His) guanylyltransferase